MSRLIYRRRVAVWIAVGSAAPLAGAADNHYVGPASGSWQTPANWSLGTAPSSSDTTDYLDSATAASVLISGVTTSSFASTLSVNNVYLNGPSLLTIDSTASALVPLNISSGFVVDGGGTFNLGGGAVNTNTFDTGYSGVGTTTQNGGTLAVATDFHVGRSTGGIGAYTLNSGVLSVTESEYVGESYSTVNAVGVFQQNGGTNTAELMLSIGAQSVGSGQYNLAGGTLSVDGYFTVGTVGTVVQTGGTVNVSTTPTYESNLDIGGSYSLSQPNNAVPSVINVANAVSIASANGAAATFTMTGGTLNTPYLSAGTSGVGFFNQAGGAVSVSGSLQIGSQNGASGSYQLSAGTLTVGGTEYLSDYFANTTATGSFLQNGGNNSCGILSIDSQNTGSGSYTITGGNLIVTTAIEVGATSAFNQIGGNVSITAPANQGPYLYDTGIYNLSSGDLKCGEYVYGTFHQTGGTQELYMINVAPAAGQTALYQVDAGTINVGTVSIGSVNSSSSFLLGTAASLTVNYTFVNYGTTILSGVQNYASGATFTNYAGTTTFNSDAGSITQNLNLIASGGTVNLEGTQHLASLNVGVGSIVNAVTDGLGNPSNLMTPSLIVSGAFTLNSGTASIGSQTVINPGGTLTVDTGAILTATSPVNNGTILEAGGHFNFSGTITGTGTIQQIAGVTTVAAGTLVTSGAVQVGGSAVTNAVQNYVFMPASGATTTFTASGSSTTTVSSTFAIANTGSGSASAVFSGNAVGNVGTALVGPTGSLSVSGNASLNIAGGLLSNGLTTFGGGTITVQYGPVPAGEDPELYQALVAGYNGSGSIVNTGAIATTPYLKLGITSGSTGTYNQTGGTTIVTTALCVGCDVNQSSGSGIGMVNISGGITSAASLLAGSTAGGVGTITVGGTGTLSMYGPVSISNGSSLTVNPGGTLKFLAHTGPANASSIGGLSITGGTVDITNNAIDLPGASLPTIVALVASGFSGGTWTGPASPAVPPPPTRRIWTPSPSSSTTTAAATCCTTTPAPA